MNVLIIGAGGREHALGWKLKQSPKVEKIYFALGNGGTLNTGKNIDVDLKNHSKIIEWVKNNNIGLVVIGPDEYLADGLVDSLTGQNIKVFGPTKAAAEIEWSKLFAKELMVKEGIPTAKFEIFSNIEKARKYLESQTYPVVIKANGLALGKGVLIAKNIEEANEALAEIMEKKMFGDAGREVVIEEFLVGEELSIHAFCDGNTAILFPPSQDHKRIYDGDKGPNTGGMGTIAPLPNIREKDMGRIEKEIVLPTLNALKKLGRPFKGILYPGIMMTDEGPKVIEFNARFGDPEAQSYMRLLKSDLLDILLACVDGKLKDLEVEWNNKSACCVILASAEYPGSSTQNIPITGVKEGEEIGDVIIFHSGTKFSNDELKTNGGRVLGITATGDDLNEALLKTYRAIEKIKFTGMQYRKDIGKNQTKQQEI